MKTPEHPYEVRCPLHGSISFSKREKEILDHPLVQRLRYISQLGFSFFVYPGATHTRFSHALGVMHTAHRIFDRMLAYTPSLTESLTPEERAYCMQVVRLAGLLHDIGHFPFSHAFEPLLPLRKTLSLPVAWYRDFQADTQATHEDFSVAALKELALSGVLDETEAQDIASLVDGQIKSARLEKIGGGASSGVHFLLKQIISGELDADRMDYLPRDAHYAGVPYGYFDRERLIQSISAIPDSKGWLMALDHTAVYTYEHFLMTRFHMAMQVYLHKTVLVFDYFLEQAAKTGEIDCDVENGLDSLLNAREGEIITRLHQAAGPNPKNSKSWSARILARQPLSRLVQIQSQEEQEKKDLLMGELKNAGIEAVLLQAKRRLSTEGSEDPPLMVRSGPIGSGKGRNSRGRNEPQTLRQVSVLLERYDQDFLIENIYCEPKQLEKAHVILEAIL